MLGSDCLSEREQQFTEIKKSKLGAVKIGLLVETGKGKLRHPLSISGGRGH